MRLKIVPLVGDTIIKRLQYSVKAILLNLVHFLVNIKEGDEVDRAGHGPRRRLKLLAGL